MNYSTVYFWYEDAENCKMEIQNMFSIPVVPSFNVNSIGND